MRSVADQLRADRARRVAALPPARRLALALALGDRDLSLFQASHPGLARAVAVRELRGRRQRGRRPSACASAADA